MTSHDPLPDAAEGTGETGSRDDPGEAGPTDAHGDCPFCIRKRSGEYDLAGWDVISFEPLNPVTPGHRLFVPVQHVSDAASDHEITGKTFRAAAMHAAESHEAFNLITSAGADATQTVRHLHVHYVPRRAGDGLVLPWTNQGVRDLAAPSNGENSSRPSPGADPRIEAALAALHADKDWHHVAFGTWRTNYEAAARISIATADAADRAADPPWIRVRCDETTKGTVYDWIVDGIPHNDVGLRHDINLVFAALVALRGEQ